MMQDHLGPECRQHFDRVIAELKQRGIAYEIVPRLVRGLDYYTKTTFEITSGALGAQNAVLGGGRYDGLSEAIGGPPAPGIGFSIGEDRLVLAHAEAARSKAEASGAQETSSALIAYIAWLGDTALGPSTSLARELRRQGFSIEVGYEPVKLKKSLGMASRLQARFAIIIGEGELASGRYQVKNMNTGEQEEVEHMLIAEYLKENVTKEAQSTTVT